jgi:uncharacterized protein (DUF427 family)
MASSSDAIQLIVDGTPREILIPAADVAMDHLVISDEVQEHPFLGIETPIHFRSPKGNLVVVAHAYYNPPSSLAKARGMLAFVPNLNERLSAPVLSTEQTAVQKDDSLARFAPALEPVFRRVVNGILDERRALSSNASTVRSKTMRKVELFGAVLASSEETVIFREANFPDMVFFSSDSINPQHVRRGNRAVLHPVLGLLSLIDAHVGHAFYEGVGFFCRNPPQKLQALTNMVAFLSDMEYHQTRQAVVQSTRLDQLRHAKDSIERKVHKKGIALELKQARKRLRTARWKQMQFGKSEEPRHCEYLGHTIARSNECYVLREIGEPPLVFFPPTTLSKSMFRPNPLSIRVDDLVGEFQGYDILIDDHVFQDAAWALVQSSDSKLDSVMGYFVVESDLAALDQLKPKSLGGLELSSQTDHDDLDTHASLFLFPDASEELASWNDTVRPTLWESTHVIPCHQAVRVSCFGQSLASTSNALLLCEQHQAPLLFVPMDSLGSTSPLLSADPQRDNVLGNLHVYDMTIDDSTGPVGDILSSRILPSVAFALAEPDQRLHRLQDHLCFALPLETHFLDICEYLLPTYIISTAEKRRTDRTPSKRAARRASTTSTPQEPLQHIDEEVLAKEAPATKASDETVKQTIFPQDARAANHDKSPSTTTSVQKRKVLPLTRIPRPAAMEVSSPEKADEDQTRRAPLLAHQKQPLYIPPKNATPKVDTKGLALPSRPPLKLPTLPEWQNVELRPAGTSIGVRGTSRPLADKIGATTYRFVFDALGGGQWSISR